MIPCPKNCGKCCAPIPFPNSFLVKHRDKLQQDSSQRFKHKVRGTSEQLWVIITPNLKCPFWNPEIGCAVYDDRPDICRKFGEVEKLPCPYFRMDGTRRTEDETKEILKRIDRMTEPEENKV